MLSGFKKRLNTKAQMPPPSKKPRIETAETIQPTRRDPRFASFQASLLAKKGDNPTDPNVESDEDKKVPAQDPETVAKLKELYQQSLSHQLGNNDSVPVVAQVHSSPPEDSTVAILKQNNFLESEIPKVIQSLKDPNILVVADDRLRLRELILNQTLSDKGYRKRGSRKMQIMDILKGNGITVKKIVTQKNKKSIEDFKPKFSGNVYSIVCEITLHQTRKKFYQEEASTGGVFSV